MVSNVSSRFTSISIVVHIRWWGTGSDLTHKVRLSDRKTMHGREAVVRLSRTGTNLDPTFTPYSTNAWFYDNYSLTFFRSDILSDPVWIMRLLEYNNDGEFSLTKDFISSEIPEYAILSHT
jgi:hypothetical protein